MFKTEAELTGHLRLAQSCEVQLAELPEGYNKEQEKLLRRRKRVDCSEEDRWREMYMVLFPDDDRGMIPTPCTPQLYPVNSSFANQGQIMITKRSRNGKNDGTMSLISTSSICDVSYLALSGVA